MALKQKDEQIKSVFFLLTSMHDIFLSAYDIYLKCDTMSFILTFRKQK